MDFSFRYTAEDHCAALPVADYIARFRDAMRFLECCRACRNYNRSWGCPPFGYDVGAYLSQYTSALIIATKITPAEQHVPMSEAGRLSRPERQRLERRLLEMERRYGGRSKPCRLPDLVRPSLEACGFDIAHTTSELFGIELKWGTDGSLPEYLTLVCGFFHNAENIIWNG